MIGNTHNGHPPLTKRSSGPTLARPEPSIPVHLDASVFWLSVAVRMTRQYNENTTLLVGSLVGDGGGR